MCEFRQSKYSVCELPFRDIFSHFHIHKCLFTLGIPIQRGDVVLKTNSVSIYHITDNMLQHLIQFLFVSDCQIPTNKTMLVNVCERCDAGENTDRDILEVGEERSGLRLLKRRSTKF